MLSYQQGSREHRWQLVTQVLMWLTSLTKENSTIYEKNLNFQEQTVILDDIQSISLSKLQRS